MPSVETMAAFALASLVIASMPGPAVAYVVTRSIEQGAAAGLVSVLGLETAAVVHAGLSAVGATAVLALAPTGMQLIAGGGASYLVWLAARALHEGSGTPSGSTPRPAAGRGRLYLDGVLVDLLNPKTALFFLAFLPQFVTPDHGPPGAQLAILGALFVAVAALCDTAYALLAGRLSTRLRSSPTARRRLAAASSLVYLTLALGALTFSPGG